MNCCEGCLKNEREALLALNAQFYNPLTWEDNTNCCDWKRAQCNTTTKRVVELDLSFVMDYNRLRNWYVKFSDVVAFEDLKILELSGNSIAYFVEYEGSKILTKLKVLRLIGNRIGGNMLRKSIMRPFSSISQLYRSNNQLNGAIYVTDFHYLGNLESLVLDSSSKLVKGLGLLSLSNLEILDLNYNNISNFVVLEGSKSLTKLKVLRLDEDKIDGNMLRKSTVQPFSSISELYLSFNQFNGAIVVSGLLSLRNLEILDLSNNNINNFVVREGSKSLTKLKVLRLDGNKMDGNMLRMSILPFSFISELYLSYNQFTRAIVAVDFCDLANLEHLELDHSSNLVNEFFKTIGLLTSLKLLYLRGCGITGTLPATEWYKLKKLEELDLSENKFEGSLPSSFCYMTSLPSPFSNNSNIKFIYGNRNKVVLDTYPTLQTWVPKFQLYALHMSSSTITKFVPLPHFLLYQNHLVELDLSSLKLEVGFPNWLLENNIRMLNLVLSSCSLKGALQLQMNNNELSSLPKRMLQENSSLVMLDLSHNQISSSIQDMIQDLDDTGLTFLLLGDNHFTRKIPNELCQLRDISILDLSHNDFYGSIPSCLGKIPFENNPDILIHLIDDLYVVELINTYYRSTIYGTLYNRRNDANLQFVKQEATFTTKKSSYTYTGSILAYMNGIDLSYNNLAGTSHMSLET
ncbi:unnamed protein product [Lupinus luteus]|uniref:Leucine-rich repeat-containing N-terminal plant-type domain-containing protein n=1 Tax=Lupinus luteus TaxID=3873 RepID=A0AAV1WYP3_LUPLU